MTMPGPLLHRMRQQISRRAFTGFSVRGDPTFSTAVTRYPARTEGYQHLVTGKDGRDVMSKTVTYIGPSSSGDPVFTVEDRIILPDGTTPRILAVDSYPDWRSAGPYYIAVHT